MTTFGRPRSTVREGDEVAANRRQGRRAVYAEVGDRLFVPSAEGDDSVHDAEVLEVRHEAGTPLYLVRWAGTGHTCLVGHVPGLYVQHFGQDGA